MSESMSNESRGKPLAVGLGIILGLMSAVISLLIFWRIIPGWVGETVGMVAGIISTPFFLEASFGIMGIFIVVMLNNWRRHRAGDEFVSFDEKELPSEYRSDVKDRS